MTFQLFDLSYIPLVRVHRMCLQESNLLYQCWKIDSQLRQTRLDRIHIYTRKKVNPLEQVLAIQVTNTRIVKVVIESTSE